MGFDDFFYAILKFRNSSDVRAKEAIIKAIKETESFITRRIGIDPVNIFICENSECSAVANAWKSAYHLMKNVQPKDCLGLETKIEFWTDKSLRESELYHSKFATNAVPYLRDIKNKFGI